MNPRIFYRHRQTSWMTVVVAAVPFLAIAVITLLSQPSTRGLPQGLVAGLCVAALVGVAGFSWLDVVITADYLVARFGIGLLRKTVPLSRIVRTEAVETRWYDGWGIHWTSRGMLYNVGGFGAVRITLDNGRSLMIGSDEARRLNAALQQAIASRR